MLNFLERRMKETRGYDRKKEGAGHLSVYEKGNEDLPRINRESFPQVQHSKLDANHNPGMLFEGPDFIDIEYSFSDIDRRESIPHASFTQQIREISEVSQSPSKKGAQN
mmetsp:Transcript_45830/g.33567  ORF Transcript_45830/g.33567 Transcript_45830/m.33567 type:complete len:109 (+) Transcript_45830:716-1042(+)